jgi:hypothetical protein
MAEETWDDFISAAGEEFDLPPEGEYQFIIKEAEAKTSKSGNPMIRVKATITEGPHAGKSIKDFYVLRISSQVKKFMAHMRAMGITLETLREQKPTMEQIAKVMEGKPFQGQVVHDTNDRWGDSAELSWAMRAPEGGATAVTSFPALNEAEALGYGSNESTVATDNDAGF